MTAAALDDAYEQNISLNKGADQSLSLSNWSVDGVMMDLAGVTVELEVKRLYPDTTNLLKLTSGGGGITVSSTVVGQVITGNVIVANFSAAQTAALSGRGVFNLRVTFTNGTKRRLVKGAWEALA